MLADPLNFFAGKALGQKGAFGKAISLEDGG
jgi:hypothetical protein